MKTEQTFHEVKLKNQANQILLKMNEDLKTRKSLLTSVRFELSKEHIKRSSWMQLSLEKAMKSALNPCTFSHHWINYWIFCLLDAQNFCSIGKRKLFFLVKITTATKNSLTQNFFEISKQFTPTLSVFSPEKID